MKSIRRGLTLSLLSGLAILWLVAGSGIYMAVEHSLIKSLDAELALHARVIRFAARSGEESTDNRTGPRRLQDRIPAYDDPDGNAFYQTWSSGGEVQGKSVSLGEQSFSFPGETEDSAPVFETLPLGNENETRTMRFRSISGGGKGKGRRGGATITLLGLDTAPVRETLQSVLTGIVIIGAILGLAAMLWVRVGISIGLKPLSDLAQRTRELDAHSLDARLKTTGIPAELIPVYSQLNNLIERLENSFERERRFNADLAHEMRTPVAELRMLNEVALKWEDQAGETTHQGTLEICDQLESTIETLLALARCESGEVKPELKTLNWEATVTETWKTFSRRAAERKLQVGFHFPEKTSSFQADPTLLHPILNNLFSNAVHYAPVGDRLEISGKDGQLSVTNSAPGLDEADVENLFDRYWRADSSRSDSGRVGLGLSLAKACAKASGFELQAHLDQDRLRFTLSVLSECLPN